MSGVMEKGIEFSDMSSFYSSLGGGFRNIRTGMYIRMRHGYVVLHPICNTHTYGWHVTMIEPSWFYDMVTRVVFPICSDTARIAGREVKPDGKYHQFPVSECFVNEWRISIHKSHLPKGWRQEMYVRSEGDKWIVHARAMITEPHLLVLKGIDGTSKVWFGPEKERSAYWRRRELISPTFDTQIQPHRREEAGTHFVIVVKIERV